MLRATHYRQLSGRNNTASLYRLLTTAHYNLLIDKFQLPPAHELQEYIFGNEQLTALGRQIRHLVHYCTRSYIEPLRTGGYEYWKGRQAALCPVWSTVLQLASLCMPKTIQLIEMLAPRFLQRELTVLYRIVRMDMHLGTLYPDCSKRGLRQF